MAKRTYPSYWMYKDNRSEYRGSYEAFNGETIAVRSKLFAYSYINAGFITLDVAFLVNVGA